MNMGAAWEKYLLFGSRVHLYSGKTTDMLHFFIFFSIIYSELLLLFCQFSIRPYSQFAESPFQMHSNRFCFGGL